MQRTPLNATLRFVILSSIVLLRAGAQPRPTEVQQNNMVVNRFITSPDGDIYVVSSGTLLRMVRDEGDQWERVAEDVRNASIDPKNSNTLYIVTVTNLLLKTVDRGKSWVKVQNGIPNTKINFIFASSQDSQTLFAGTGAGLYRTTDGGFSWEPTTLTSAVRQFYMNPRVPNYAYALTEEGAVMVSNDSGATWQRSTTGLPIDLVPTGGRTAARSIAAITTLFPVPHKTGYLIAVTADNRPFRSDNHGGSWRYIGTGIDPHTSLTTAYVTDNRVVFGGNKLVQYDGENWSEVPVKTNRFTVGRYVGVAKHPKRDGLLVLFRYTSDREDTSRIAYVDKNGALVGLTYGVLPRSDVLSVHASRLADKAVIFATVHNEAPGRRPFELEEETATYISHDEGYSWEFLTSPECGYSIIARPGQPNEVWMLSSFKRTIWDKIGSCILRSWDGGLTWQKARGTLFETNDDLVSKIAFDPVDKTLLYYTAGVNDYHLYRYKYSQTAPEGQTVRLNVFGGDIVVCGERSKILYAGVGQLSTDGGWTWTDKSQALTKYIERNFAKTYRRTDFTLLSCVNSTIRIAIHRGRSSFQEGRSQIIVSSDLGDTWAVLYSFPSNEELMRIFVDSERPNEMFAVTAVFDARGNLSVVRVLETNDFGATWRVIFSRALDRDDRNHASDIVRSVAQLVSKGGRSIFLGGRIGLWRSDDEGRSWSRLGGVR